MKTNRREFLKVSSLALAGGLLLPSCLASSKEEREIGIQLYSVSKLINADPLQALKSLKQIGFNSIEPYAFNGKIFNQNPMEFKKMASDLELKMRVTHCEFTDDEDMLINEAAKVGFEYIVLPWTLYKKTLDSYDQAMLFVEKLNRLGEKCKKAGLKLTYHNLAEDFHILPTGQRVIDLYFENTDKDILTFQLDTGQVNIAGYKTEDMFKKYPGRFELLHLKDVQKDGISDIIGAGVVDFKEIMKYKETAGLKHIYVEQEDFKGSVLEELKSGLQYMKKNKIY